MSVKNLHSPNRRRGGNEIHTYAFRIVDIHECVMKGKIFSKKKFNKVEEKTRIENRK